MLAFLGGNPGHCAILSCNLQDVYLRQFIHGASSQWPEPLVEIQTIEAFFTQVRYFIILLKYQVLVSSVPAWRTCSSHVYIFLAVFSFQTTLLIHVSFLRVDPTPSVRNHSVLDDTRFKNQSLQVANGQNTIASYYLSTSELSGFKFQVQLGQQSVENVFFSNWKTYFSHTLFKKQNQDGIEIYWAS